MIPTPDTLRAAAQAVVDSVHGMRYDTSSPFGVVTGESPTTLWVSGAAIDRLRAALQGDADAPVGGLREAIAALPGIDIEVSREAVPLARFQEALTLDPAKTQVWYRDDGGMVDRAAVLEIVDRLAAATSSADAGAGGLAGEDEL